MGLLRVWSIVRNGPYKVHWIGQDGPGPARLLAGTCYWVGQDGPGPARLLAYWIGQDGPSPARLHAYWIGQDGPSPARLHAYGPRRARLNTGTCHPRWSRGGAWRRLKRIKVSLIGFSASFVNQFDSSLALGRITPHYLRSF